MAQNVTTSLTKLYVYLMVDMWNCPILIMTHLHIKWFLLLIHILQHSGDNVDLNCKTCLYY